jgi:DNA polymerase III epsilon subunit family exonuclease
MSSGELIQLRNRAYRFLLEADRPQPTPRLARCLFGARRHELPETQAVVRSLLATDPRFIATHDNRWSARGCGYLGQALRDTTFTVVDLETTGSVIGVDEVIEIGVVVLRGGRIVERFGSLIWTERAIPRWVRRLTGLGKAELAGAPVFDDLAPRLHDLLAGTVFVAHDLRFDLPFVRWELGKRGYAEPEVTGLCTLRLAQMLWPHLESHALAELARRFGLTHEQPHRAFADAEAAANLLNRALHGAAALGLQTLGDLLLLTDDYAAGAVDASAAEV